MAIEIHKPSEISEASRLAFRAKLGIVDFQIVSGGQVTVTGNTVTVSELTFTANDQTFTVPASNFTIQETPESGGRFDVIYLQRGTLNSIKLHTGTASERPLKWNVNPLTEIELVSLFSETKHTRAHQIDSIDDHPPVPEGKRGKIVATDPVTGAIVLIDPVGGGDSYEYWKLKGGKVPKYGLLYNWYAATDERNITSSDTWVVPTSTQRNTLFTYIGGTSTVGGKLKELGLVYWLVNVGATNEYGFNARGAGERTASSFDGLGAHTRIMCSNQLNTTNMQGWQLVGNSNNWTNAGSYKYIGWSIRLMRPATAEEQLLADGTACENYIGNDGKIYRTVKNRHTSLDCRKFSRNTIPQR